MNVSCSVADVICLHPPVRRTEDCRPAPPLARTLASGLQSVAARARGHSSTVPDSDTRVLIHVTRGQAGTRGGLSAWQRSEAEEEAGYQICEW